MLSTCSLKTNTSSHMRIQWDPPPVGTSLTSYFAFALPDQAQGDDLSISPNTNILTGHTTDDATDMSSTTTTPQETTPQSVSPSESSLGNLGPALSFLNIEKRVLKQQPTSINLNVTSGSLGDFTQVFRYLKTQRHQVEAQRSPAHMSSSTLGLLSSLLGPMVMGESKEGIAFTFIRQDYDQESEVPSQLPSLQTLSLQKPEKRKLKKKVSRRILAIDEPSSCSGGGCASSESDQKETFVEEKTSMENVDVCVKEVTKTQQTDPKNTHTIHNKPQRIRRLVPTPPKKWHWTQLRTMKEMERLFHSERVAQEDRHKEHSTITIKIRGQERFDCGTEDDDHRANSRPGNSVITKPQSRTFWSRNSEYVQKTYVVQTKYFDERFCAPTTSAQSKSEEPQSPLSHLVAMRKRDMFLVPKGLDRLAKVLPRSPSVTCSSSTDTSEEEDESPGTTTTPTTTPTTSPVSSTAQPEKQHPPTSNPVTLGAIWPIADQNNGAIKRVPGPERVFIFVDNSNILTGFYHYYERAMPSPTLPHHLNKHNDNTKDTFLEAPPSSPRRQESDTDSEEETVLYPRTRSCKNYAPKDASSTITPSISTEPSVTSSTDMAPQMKSQPIMVKSRAFRPKFDYASFFSLLQRSRPTERRILVGSAPLYQELDVAMEYQYETKILRRVRKFVQGELGVVPVPIKQPRYTPHSEASILSNNNYNNPDPFLGGLCFDKDARPSSFTSSGPGSAQGEQCVDELLHLKMLETILDHEPAVMVLATGDGGDSEFGGEGFYGVIKRALGRGWHVEIVSWKDQLSGVYIELAQEYKYPPENHKGLYRPSHKQHGRHPDSPQALGQRKGSLRIICLDWVGKEFAQP